MKQAMHDGTRQWSNVGHTCSRCWHEVKVGEKSERFRTKGGRLRIRHVGDCPQARRHPSTDAPIGCGCLDCVGRLFKDLIDRITGLPYPQYEELLPLHSRAAGYRRTAVRLSRDQAVGWVTEADAYAAQTLFREAYMALWQESRRFLHD